MTSRGVIFDVGGVLLHERDHSKRFEWENRLGLSRGELTGLVLDSEPAAHAASGRVPESQVWQSVGTRLGLNGEQIQQLQRDFWSGEQLDTTLARFIADLRPRFRIGILSNAWSDARVFHNSRFGMNQWTDVAIYSAEVGFLKPDPRIYRLVLDALCLPAEACAFVDDKLENVQAAEKLGMKGILYRESRPAIDAIREWAALDDDAGQARGGNWGGV